MMIANRRAGSHLSNSSSWKYEGKLINSDDKYIELLDFKSSSYKIVEILDINNLEIKE